MFCENCGAYNDDNAKFCGNCGSSMSSVLKAAGSVTPEQNSAPNNTVTVNRNYSSYKSETVNNTIPEQKSITTDTSYGNTAVKRSIKKSLIIILIILLIVGAVGIIFVYYNHKEKSFDLDNQHNSTDKYAQAEADITKAVTTKASTAKTTVETTAKAAPEAESDEETYSITIEAEEILEEAGVKLGGHVGIAVLSNLFCNNGNAVINSEKIHIYDNLISVTVTDITAESVRISGTITTYGLDNLDGQTISYPDIAETFILEKAVGEAAKREQLNNEFFAGKWECQEMKMDVLTVSVFFEGIPVAAMLQMELRKDGTGTIMVIDEDSENLNWQAEGDMASIMIDGETTEFKKEGNKIVATEVDDGEKFVITLVKVDEFTKYENNVTITSNPVNNMRGQINCHGGTVAGYTTDYVVNGGAVGKVRNSLGDTWHVTAKNVCTNYGVTWYELWDSDDGDYYGWVDSNYIDFY